MNNEMHKNQDFLYNVREIAFANQCEIISKFNVIFTLKVNKSLSDYGTTFSENVF